MEHQMLKAIILAFIERYYGISEMENPSYDIDKMVDYIYKVIEETKKTTI